MLWEIIIRDGDAAGGSLHGSTNRYFVETKEVSLTEKLESFIGDKYWGGDYEIEITHVVALPSMEALKKEISNDLFSDQDNDEQIDVKSMSIKELIDGYGRSKGLWPREGEILKQELARRGIVADPTDIMPCIPPKYRS